MSTAVTPPNEPHDTSGHDTTTDSPSSGVTSASRTVETREVVRRQKERFGGMKFGACFFGWLTATGTAVLLSGLLTAAGAAFGLSQTSAPGDASANAQTIGLVGGIVLLVLVLVSYLAGGYVAGRMARFNGVRQGVGVWLWAIIIAVVVAILSVIAGAQFNVLSNLSGVPRIPIDQATLTAAGVITAVLIVIAALVGAILGGLLGMRYHRRVDQADLSNAR